MNQDLLSQAAFEALPVPAYVKDKQGVYRLANQALADFFGEAIEAIIGKTDAELGRAFLETIAESDQAVLKTGQATVYPENLAYIKKSVFKDDQGNVVGTLGVVLPQRECEELFSERQAHYEKLFTALPGNVYVKDIQGRLLDCNDQQANWFGFKTREKIVGKNTKELADETDIKRFEETSMQKIDSFDEEVLNKKLSKVGEESVMSSDGKLLHVLSHKKPMLDKSGEVIGLIGISIDITEQVEMEHTLRQIVAVMPGNVYWKNSKGILQGCNNQQLKVFGYECAEEIIGKKTINLLPDYMSLSAKQEAADKVDTIDQEVINLDEPRTIEEVGATKSGDKIYYLSYKVPLHNRQGEVTGLVGISVDITDKKLAELQLRDALSQKSAILSTLVNEFRSYFSAQKIILDTVLNEGVSSHQRELAQMLLQANIAKEQMLDYAAEFTKLDSGELEVECIRLRLIPRLEKLVEQLYCQRNGEVEVFLTLKSPLNEWLIGANPDYLFNVLALPASTIAEQTAAGHINVVVERIQIEGQAFIRVQFEYTGEPIDDDIINKLSSNKAFGSSLWGSAINLAYSRKFLEAMGGQYYLANEPGKGTVLRLDFQDMGEQDYGVDYKLQGQLKVAVIDFNKARRKSVMSNLWNTVVDEFSDVAAFEAKGARDYDAIILDEAIYNLTVRDRFAARQQELNLLILTTDSPRSQRYQQLRIFYLSKPVVPLSLNKKLHGLSEQHQILVVEDDTMLRHALKTHLEAAGFMVDIAKDGQQALQLANGCHEAVVMDIGLPDKTGVKVAETLLEQRVENPPKIVAFTGLTHEYNEDDLEATGLFDSIIVKGKPMSDVVNALRGLLGAEQ